MNKKTYVDYRTDDDVRFWRLIAATLNEGWASHPDNSIRETYEYLHRATHAGCSIDLHQNKDRTSDGAILTTVTDMTDVKEL